MLSWLKHLFFRTDLTLPSTNLQQLSAYPATRPTDEIDKALVKEAESALRAMKDYTEESEDDNIFARLIIEEPEEFRSKHIIKITRNR